MVRDNDFDFVDVLEMRDELGSACIYDEYVVCSPSCPEWERCGYVERGGDDIER